MKPLLKKFVEALKAKGYEVEVVEKRRSYRPNIEMPPGLKANQEILRKELELIK